MSLYLGKDTNNSNILAISRGSKSESDMKSTQTDFSDFVFHSKASYMFADILEYTVSWPSGYKEVSISIPSSFMVRSGVIRTVFVFINDVYVTIKYDNSMPVVNGFGACYNYNTSSQKLFLHDYSKASGESSRILVIATNYYGLINRNEDSTLSGSILLKKESFTLSGVDYFSKKWLVTPPVNNIDKQINLLGTTYQIVNYYPSSGSFKLESSSGIKISRGGKLLLDSTVSNFHPLAPNNFYGTSNLSKLVYLRRSSGENSPFGFGSASIPSATVSFNIGITATNTLILLEMVESTSNTSLGPLLMNTSYSSWINYAVGFVPPYTGVGFCNVRFGLRLVNGVLYFSVDGGNCMSNTNDAHPFTVSTTYYVRYIYVTK